MFQDRLVNILENMRHFGLGIIDQARGTIWNRWKWYLCKNQLLRNSIIQKFKAAFLLGHPFRGECKTDFQAPCTWIKCGNSLALIASYKARNVDYCRKMAFKHSFYNNWSWYIKIYIIFGKRFKCKVKSPASVWIQCPKDI